ncbi:hypothetical protein O6H91_20G004400 [Diphasiastrum complanatum]|uniref:Uncharacterized protein n=1 Tax=Diphasiastrum complanatum TaxID=34168 RepID=A0ACC2ANI4_DIPCM|nr:hypothetical protein O6H91_20G004400 [Diphasiastrum complanatum]
MANWGLLLDLIRLAAASMELVTRALERLHGFRNTTRRLSIGSQPNRAPWSMA